VAAVPVEVVPPQKKCGKSSVRLGELPWLDLGDFIECGCAYREASMSSKAQIRCESVTEILRIPVKLVGRADNSERRERQISTTNSTFVCRADINRKSFNAIVCLARRNREATVIAVVKQRSKIDRRIWLCLSLLSRGGR
jgi:hypothetical protein